MYRAWKDKFILLGCELTMRESNQVPSTILRHHSKAETRVKEYALPGTTLGKAGGGGGEGQRELQEERQSSELFD